MKLKRMTATLLAIVMLATMCCSMLLSCADDSSSGGEYTITFNANGGTVNPTSATTTGGKLASLPTPTKANTEFLGWYISSIFSGEKLTVDYVYSYSCIVHAKWGETQTTEYTVSFDANGGTLAADTSSMLTVNGKLLALPADPIPPTNTTFLGWFTEKTVGDRVDTDYEFTGETKEVTVYAHYLQEYVITFDAGEYTVDEPSRLTVNGRLIGKLPTPTGFPTSKRFAGWYIRQSGGKEVTSSTAFTSNCSIYAIYLDADEYIIKLNANGGTLADYIEVMFTVNGILVTLPAPPTPPKGYEFAGWFTSSTGGRQVQADTEFIDDETIWAQYLLVEFIVSFDANDGRLAPGTTTIMTEDKKLTSMPYRPFAPKGQRFIGWFTRRDGGERVDKDYLFTGTPDRVTLYAHYDVAIIRDDGLWTDDAQKGVFANPSAGEVWAINIDLRIKDVALEIWYGGELITNVTRDPFSTPKVELGPDMLLRLADGADISNSIINVLYKFGSEEKEIYIQEVVRANLQADDGVYIDGVKQTSFSQNLASEEVMVENLTVGEGGTTELTIVFGGNTVEVAHFGKDVAVKALLASNKKKVIIAAGTYSIFYNYGVTDPSSSDYKKLFIQGRSTGDLPETDEPINDSPYYMVGSSATLGLTWIPIESASLIPDNIHFEKTGDNTYSLTVDLYEGNQFKILKAGDADPWAGAYTFQSLEGNTGSTAYFVSSNSMDNNNDHNVYVKTSGNYTLTINTATKKLSFVRNGEAANVKVAFDVYIHGTFKGAGGWEDRKVLSNQAAGTVTFTYTLSAGVNFGFLTRPYNQSNQLGWGAYVQVVTNNTKGGIGKASSSNDLTCVKAGTYQFTFTLDSAGGISSIKIDTAL